MPFGGDVAEEALDHVQYWCKVGVKCIVKRGFRATAGHWGVYAWRLSNQVKPLPLKTVDFLPCSSVWVWRWTLCDDFAVRTLSAANKVVVPLRYESRHRLR